MAEYLTAQKIAELGVKKDSGLERDSTFRTNAERKLERQQEKEQTERKPEHLPTMAFEQPDEPAPHVELELLSVRILMFAFGCQGSIC